MQIAELRDYADQRELTGFNIKLLVWCALIIIFDGYDLAVVGIALPVIMADMGVNATSAGFMVSSALFGMMFGALIFGTLADRIGRITSISLCVALFSLGTAASGLVDDPVLFSILRFVAGLGIGGVMPNVVAEMTEFSPKRFRSTLITLMFSGYAIGGLLATLMGKQLLESYGWRPVFFAAAVPALLIPFFSRSLPESINFLVTRGRTDALRRILAGWLPDADIDVSQLVASSDTQTGTVSVRQLFSEQRARNTLMFWIAFFMCLFLVYAVGSWLTKLMLNAGFPLGSSLNLVLSLYFGGMLGAVTGGWLADRLPIKWVALSMFVIAAVAIALVGQAGDLPSALLLFIVAVVGACTIGTQIVVYAFVGQYYPIEISSTGVGWASAAGRSGGIIAPIVIGVLISMNLPLTWNFGLMAIPAVIAALAIWLVTTDNPVKDSDI